MTDASLPSRAYRIARLIEAGFPGATVEIADDSHRHAGHAGARPEGETHYRARIVAPGFAGLGRVARQQAVMALLKEEFAGGLHALNLACLTPEEATARQG